MTYPVEELLRVLSIYKFPFINDPEHLQYLENQYYLNGHYLCSATKLFLPKSVTDRKDISDMQILQHITKRIPVYYGKPMLDLFCWKKLKKTLAYDYNDLEIDKYLVSNIRYAITGPINIMPYMETPEMRAWVIHLWGVNFETTYTEDYAILYNKKGMIDLDIYLERQIDIFKLINQSANYAKDVEGVDRVIVHVPMIGMGQYLSSLSEKEKEACQLLFLEGLITVLEMTRDSKNMVWKLCIFSPNDYSSEYHDRLYSLTQQFSHFIIGQGNRDGNIMNMDFSDHGLLNCIVNAWDSRSFIGNGGSVDKTVDGFIVANAGGYNNQFRNTSFLHNSFFCPNILNPKRWKLEK